MTRVYIAGPYSQGDVAVNVRNAIAAANQLANRGFYPYIPHLTHFWHLMFPRPYNFWIEMDKIWLPVCDVLLRLPGPSSGADGEVELARSLGMPIYTDIETLLEMQP